VRASARATTGVTSLLWLLVAVALFAAIPEVMARLGAAVGIGVAVAAAVCAGFSAGILSGEPTIRRLRSAYERPRMRELRQV